MNALINFWNLMTTENEMLTKIVTAPTVVIEAWLIFKLFTSFLKISFTTKQKFAYIFLFSITSLFTEFFISTPYNIFVNFFVLFLIIKVLFKQNITKTIASIIIPTALFSLTGNLILNPTLKLLNISSNQLNNCIIYKFIYLFILYLIMFIIIALFTKYKVYFNTSINLDYKSKKLILLNLFLGLITIIIQLIVTFYYINTYPLAFTILNFLSLLAYFIISFYSLNRIINLQIAKIELENSENYNKTLSILYDNVKAFKHDFDNMVFTIGGFINTNDINGLKKYYTSLERDCQKTNNIALLNPQLINNPGIYNLLITKYKKAQNENIEIQLEYFFDFDKLHMPIYDFSRMLGIFLDNAIEAAASSKEKKIKIIFRDTIQSNVQIIQIENSYVSKNINTKKIFEKGITEKDNHLGMGLWEVNQILKRNNNVNLITENNDLYFKQHLEIYY